MTIRLLFTFITLQFFAPVAVATPINYSGHYELHLDVGGRVFIDELILKKDHLGSYSGKYIVPGSFESEVLDFKVKDGQFEFKIHVIEQSANYFSLFKGSIEEKEIEGKAYVLPSMELLGVFEGVSL
ncbi:MAG: hypothetical protein ACJAT2_002250 [Bacteriovoracaceae bacterium]|jgi:hypothetical protein